VGETEGEARRGQRTRTLQRVTAFTDAAVAIALTLLALPLVGFADQATARQSLFDLFREHQGDIIAFAVSFLVIALLWRTHRQLYERLDDYDEVLLTLNTLWLFMVVFLPFPTARLFVESRMRTDAAILYVGSMLVVSLIALAQTWWVGRTPALRGSGAKPWPRRALRPAIAISAVFAVATLTALASPVAGLVVLAALPFAEPVSR
jgi:uncharacterized membrane protein